MEIIVALDVHTHQEALDVVYELHEEVDYFKVGLVLLSSVGLDIVRELKRIGCRVFYDAKFHDIPSGVEKAARGVARLGVDMFSVHIQGGRDMMMAAVGDVPAVGVTELTSNDTSEEHVLIYTQLAYDCGLAGVVCSARESASVRIAFPEPFMIVTPGIRSTLGDDDRAEARGAYTDRPTDAVAFGTDQERTVSPSQVTGSSYLVIGRPVLYPPLGSRLEAIRRIKQEISIPVCYTA